MVVSVIMLVFACLVMPAVVMVVPYSFDAWFVGVPLIERVGDPPVPLHQVQLHGRHHARR